MTLSDGDVDRSGGGSDFSARHETDGRRQFFPLPSSDHVSPAGSDSHWSVVLFSSVIHGLVLQIESTGEEASQRGNTTPRLGIRRKTTDLSPSRSPRSADVLEQM
ncbi:hypothetical protein F2P81_025849 [Scophthalmus maximus]|uniref:Uncharacterized protein n=1 Tax=Scophthalmus maximus TaxID=52904 RepID=A0A6A4RP47_SCOMX|nr:hypothetical protein F2P81_025849 [Scophthalmus maximus]